MKLSEWLLKSGITQADFGMRIGVTQSRVSQICDRGTDSAAVIDKIVVETRGAVRRQDLQFRPAVLGQ
jgi:predicted XRE-type DNA-binding protein